MYTEIVKICRFNILVLNLELTTNCAEITRILQQALLTLVLSFFLHLSLKASKMFRKSFHLFLAWSVFFLCGWNKPSWPLLFSSDFRLSRLMFRNIPPSDCDNTLYFHNFRIYFYLLDWRVILKRQFSACVFWNGCGFKNHKNIANLETVSYTYW